VIRSEATVPLRKYSESNDLLENKHLDPGILDPLDPFSQSTGRRIDIIYLYLIK